MSDKPPKHPKWEKFKESMKKAGKWTVKNILPVAVSMAAGGLGLPVALGGLASELFKKFSDANLKIPITEEMLQKKLEELCKGEGKVIEYLQDKLEDANEGMAPEDIKLTIEHVMTPVVSEMSTMLEIMREEKADLRELLAGWLEEQSQMTQDGFSLTQEQLSDIQNEMLDGFQKMDLKQTQILENINESRSIMQSEFVNFKRELSELIQAVFGQSVQTAYNLDTMFNLATVHFNQQNLASRFDQPYNPDLYVRPELFFGSITEYLNDFKDPMQKNVPIFLLLAHLGMGKTWNFAYITEYLLIKRNMVIPFFINLKNGLQQQLYAIFKTQNMDEIVDRCQKIKDECQLPIFLILDGLDELTASELRDVLLMLKQLLIKRTDALCVALSCRIIAWVQDQQILNERRFFDEHVWPNQLCKDWQSQFDIATPISCVLGEFSDIELDDAIDRYGLEKEKFSAGLYKICHQPYVLRLVREFIGVHNFYPKPEEPESMKSLFYSDNREAEKNTIMYRMGVQGNIMELFYMIIKAFPSANSELPPDKFKEFVISPNFRPILYSGIILKERRQWRYVYRINSVYVPLLSQFQEFSHLSNQEKDESDLEKPRGSVGSSSQSNSAEQFQNFIKLANARRDMGKFNAELDALKKAESIANEANDFDLIIQFERRMDEFEKAKRIREEAERKAKEEAERRAKEEAERKAREEAERKAREEAERKAREEAERKAKEEAERRAREEAEREAREKARQKPIEEEKEKNVLAELEKKVGQIPIKSSIDSDTFGVKIEDNHVVGLGLFGRGLTSLPETIGQLKSLTTLSLSENKLTSLPETIGQLKSLTRLDLDNNQLTSLPETITQLKSLETLNLSWNEFTSLPGTIGQLTSLETLNLWSNQLTSLPETIGQLKSLTTLYLSYNQLTSLPETIGQLTSLEKLWLNSNQLTSLPETIGQLKSLTYLNLRENKLTSLPETIGQLTSLKELYLHYNQLTSLPETLKNLTNLKIAYVDNKMANDPVAKYWENKGVDITFME